MKKNVSGQVIGAQLINATTGAAFTGSVSVYVTGDAGTQAIGSVGSGACAHEGNGFHTYAPAQAETNYDHIAFTFIGTGAIPATVQVYPSFPQTGDNFVRLGAPAGASVSADVAAIKAETATILADTNDIQTRLPAALVSGRMDSSVGAVAAGVDFSAAMKASINAEADTAISDAALATAANLATVAGYLDTEIAAILADTNELQTDWANGGRLDLILDARASQTSVDDLPTNAELATSQAAADDATLAAIAALTIPSAATIADAVWDEALSGHTTGGSAGEALTASGGAGDPWITALPGAYSAGQAGKIVGDYLNASVSSRATQTSVDTVDDLLDTEVAAIKTVVDSILVDTAEIGAAGAGLTALATAANLATLAGYVDTEVAAIKAKTDNLPADPADASVVAGLIAAVEAKVDIVDTVVDSILVDTAEIGAAGAGLTALASAANLAAVAGYIDTEIGTLQTSVNDIPTNAELATALDVLPTAAENATAVLAAAVEGSTTVAESLRLANAALGGKASGLETTAPVYRDLADTKDRITATVDADGNRTAVTRDLT